jgi:hypothetical protein
MKRRLLNLVTVLSLLLSVAVILFWVRSYRSAPGRPAQPSNAAIQTQLARPLPVVKFSGVALSDVVSFMRDVTGVSIDVNWEALEAAGVTPNTTVSLDATNLRVGEALTALLGTGGRVAYVTRGNELYVTSRGSHDRDPMFTGIARVRPSAPDPRVRERVIGGHRWTVAADKGVLQVWRSPADPASVYQPPPAQLPQGVSGGTHILGDFTFGRLGYPLDPVQAGLPFWAMTLVIALLPLVRLTLAIWRARRKPPGHCRQCGYDLRATPERCPECGAVPAAVS